MHNWICQRSLSHTVCVCVHACVFCFRREADGVILFAGYCTVMILVYSMYCWCCLFTEWSIPQHWHWSSELVDWAWFWLSASWKCNNNIWQLCSWLLSAVLLRRSYTSWCTVFLGGMKSCFFCFRIFFPMFWNVCSVVDVCFNVFRKYMFEFIRLLCSLSLGSLQANEMSLVLSDWFGRFFILFWCVSFCRNIPEYRAGM